VYIVCGKNRDSFFFLHIQNISWPPLENLYTCIHVCVCASFSLSPPVTYISRNETTLHSKQRGMVCLLSRYRFGSRSVFVREKKKSVRLNESFRLGYVQVGKKANKIKNSSSMCVFACVIPTCK
jgi:hypothetical protein